MMRVGLVAISCSLVLSLGLPPVMCLSCALAVSFAAAPSTGEPNCLSKITRARSYKGRRRATWPVQHTQLLQGINVAAAVTIKRLIRSASSGNARSAGLGGHMLVIAVAAVLFRVGVVVSTFLHEISHVLCGVVAQQHNLCAILTGANLMGKTHLKNSAPLSTADTPQAAAAYMYCTCHVALHATSDRCWFLHIQVWATKPHPYSCV